MFPALCLAPTAAALTTPEGLTHLRPIEPTYLAADIAGMVTPPRKPQLTTRARRALELLDGLEHGAAEAFLEFSGFNRKMLAGLVHAGLVTLVTETVHIGATTIKVECYRITDDGRKAIEG